MDNGESTLDARTPILSLAGRTVARIDRDPECPAIIRLYDEHDRLMLRSMSLMDENNRQFDTIAIDHPENDGW